MREEQSRRAGKAAYLSRHRLFLQFDIAPMSNMDSSQEKKECVEKASFRGYIALVTLRGKSDTAWAQVGAPTRELLNTGHYFMNITG